MPALVLDWFVALIVNFLGLFLKIQICPVFLLLSSKMLRLYDFFVASWLTLAEALVLLEPFQN